MYIIVPGGFLKECVRTGWGCLCIPRFPKGSVWTCPGCPCIQQLLNGVQRIPQVMCLDRSGMSFLCIQKLHNGVRRIPQGMCPAWSRMSFFAYNNYTMVSGGFLRECIWTTSTISLEDYSTNVSELYRVLFLWNLQPLVVSGGFYDHIVYSHLFLDKSRDICVAASIDYKWLSCSDLT